MKIYNCSSHIILIIRRVTGSVFRIQSPYETLLGCNNYLAGIFHRRGGGGVPPIRLNNYYSKKYKIIRALQTVLNGLKHKKKSIKCVSQL